ncbi:MAG: ATP-binding protein [Candidatus Electryonea clarkiae]|nr:ATP-binding protein [Candidatus Electryonea clarkiae]MDP8286540.1 ATP-binding protein [Candidatus Electryonea clarkiae]
MSKKHTLVITSDPMRIEEVDEFLENVINELSFSRDECDDIAIAVSEAVNNAIMHGNKNDLSKKVTIQLNKLDDGLKVIVSDEGEGFDPDAVSDPRAQENIMALAGRGLLIIRHLMDKVNVQPAKNGTRISMIKLFPQS